MGGLRDGYTYRRAGVDIDAADRFVSRITPLAESTHIAGVSGSIGAFSGLFRLASGEVLAAATDGVGTKLKLAFETDRHDTVGIDLVAMSINDLLVAGAEPLFFLDYIATGHLDTNRLLAVVTGIAGGCREAGCALIGGETAEMPGMYPPGEYDLAGFAVGIVRVPVSERISAIRPGDHLLGLPSTGIHSNGYSLVRKIFDDRSLYPLDKALPGFVEPLGDILMRPTRIYRKHFDLLFNFDGFLAAAHITGGGIPGNLSRILPSGYGAVINTDTWPVPEIFKAIARRGGVPDEEMYRTFNMGLGMVLICRREKSKALQEHLGKHGFKSFIVGEVTDSDTVRLTTETPAEPSGKHAAMKTPTPTTRRLRIAIMGSGRGSNMESICRAIDRNDLAAEIVCVISNNSKAFILERARRRHIPAYHLSSRTHPDPDAFLQALKDILNRHRTDIICLAGYMKKIPPPLIEAYPGRILNIHPALLPAFGGKGMYGLHVHKAVLDSGARYSGATIHLVAPEYDQGKIIAQRIVPVLPEDTPESLADRVLKEEHELYWQAIRDHFILKTS